MLVGCMRILAFVATYLSMHSSLNLPLKLSMYALCCGLPGSMKRNCNCRRYAHSSTTLLTNSGPLSTVTDCGPPAFGQAFQHGHHTVSCVYQIKSKLLQLTSAPRSSIISSRCRGLNGYAAYHRMHTKTILPETASL